MRRVLLAVLLPLASLALVACGGGGGQSSAKAQGAVTLAARTTAGGQSYHISTQTTLHIPQLKNPVSLSGEGVFDPRRNRGRLEIDLRNLTAVLGQPVGTAQMELEGNVVYMRIPFLSASLPGLRPWLKVDLARAGHTRGIDLSSFLQLGQGADPNQVLEYLRAAGHVMKIGSEKVRGVETTHYRGTIDLERVPSLAPAAQRAQLRASIRRLEQTTGRRAIPIGVWIDAQNRVRRLRYQDLLTLQQERVELNLQSDLYDFGTPVVVPLPAPGDVTDLTKGS